MKLDDVMSELKRLGTEQTKKTFMAHGAVEPFFGVKVGDLKSIVKKIKIDYELSLALYETGNSDAMYLAGLIADEKKMTKEDLNNWVINASWQMISEYTVPWVAAESRYGFELAKEWILSKNEKVQTSGWSCLSSLAAIKSDNELDLLFFENCLDLVVNTIHGKPDRVKYCMNAFVIAAGTYISILTEKAKQISMKIGKLNIGMGNTACKVPYSLDYINKSETMGRIGKKRKMARC